MKKKVIRFGGVSLLALGLLFSVKVANAELEGSLQINETVCCQGGGKVATSSDCIRGDFACKDNTCPSGSTEQAGPNCISGGGGGGD